MNAFDAEGALENCYQIYSLSRESVVLPLTMSDTKCLRGDVAGRKIRIQVHLVQQTREQHSLRSFVIFVREEGQWNPRLSPVTKNKCPERSVLGLSSSTSEERKLKQGRVTVCFCMSVLDLVWKGDKTREVVRCEPRPESDTKSGQLTFQW